MTDPSKKERPVTSGPNQRTTNAGTNIDDEFLYSCEEDKIELQGGVGGLLELHSMLYSHLSSAREKGKDVVFIRTSELEIHLQWIIDICTGIMSHYDSIDRVNRRLHRLYKASRLYQNSNPKREEK